MYPFFLIFRMTLNAIVEENCTHSDSYVTNQALVCGHTLETAKRSYYIEWIYVNAI